MSAWRDSVQYRQALKKYVDCDPDFLKRPIAPGFLPFIRLFFVMYDSAFQLLGEADSAPCTWGASAILTRLFNLSGLDRQGRIQRLDEFYANDPSFDETCLTIGHVIRAIATSFHRPGAMWEKVIFLHPYHDFRLTDEMKLVDIWDTWRSESSNRLAFDMVSWIPFRLMFMDDSTQMLHLPIYQLRVKERLTGCIGRSSGSGSTGIMDVPATHVEPQFTNQSSLHHLSKRLSCSCQGAAIAEDTAPPRYEP